LLKTKGLLYNSVVASHLLIPANMNNLCDSVSADQQLVNLAKQGDREAFDELIRRHRSRCVNLAASILRNHGEGEEEAQNACWKAFEHIDQFHGEAEFSTWLLRIVENQCLMLIRQRRRVRVVQLDNANPEGGNGPIQVPTSDADPEGELGKRQVLHVLNTEIRRIPPLLRKVIMMRDVEELPMHDLAARLGITVPAAKSRLLRAREELRKRMLRHCTRTGPWTLMTRVAAPPERVFHQQAHRHPSI
jgi:RNA polymerase sigma-70 factor (ECF subfamily)